jgi:hypothetical protein
MVRHGPRRATALSNRDLAGGRRVDRAMRTTGWIEQLGYDLRFAIRQLKAARGVTIVAVMTVAFGVGANGAMFSLADAALIRALPFATPTAS